MSATPHPPAANTTPVKSPLRRTPTQARSRERVRRVLAAAPALIEQHGIDGLTVRQIADRAGMSIGTFYQFFANKEAVIEALTVTYIDGFLTVADDLANKPAAADWRAEWDRTYTAYVEYLRVTPGFRTIWFSSGLTPTLRRLDRSNNVHLADRLAELFVVNGHATDSPALRQAFALVIEVADTLLGLSFRRNPQGDTTVIDETQLMLRGYLAHYLDQKSELVDAHQAEREGSTGRNSRTHQHLSNIVHLGHVEKNKT